MPLVPNNRALFVYKRPWNPKNIYTNIDPKQFSRQELLLWQQEHPVRCPGCTTLHVPLTLLS